MNSQAAVLRSEDGDAVPLRGVKARGTLNGLLFELSVEQRWENTGKASIEAVYSFPVPHRATLLGLDLTIGGRELSGVALAKREASEQYEEAVEGGDTAALLEQADDGLYTVSLGNLQAGEQAVIRYRYAQLLDRHQDSVRLAVPTVIAPRFGDAAAAGLAPHQQPGTDLLADYPFELVITVHGAQARAAFSSPSHPVQVTDVAEGRQIVLGPGARLDRDFILQLSGAVTAAASVTAPDPRAASATDAQPGYVSLASLNPWPEATALRHLSLKLVVDCSGSMGGDSISQARQALKAVLGRLAPADRVSLTRFGSTVEQLVPGWRAGSRPGSILHGEAADPLPGVAMQPATTGMLSFLHTAVAGMDADLGGTNLPAALEAAIAIPSVDTAGIRDLLLITDGEVWQMEDALEAVARAGHRLFVVAVGAAPNESLARNIADTTGGACEFVTPNEDIEGAIVRMFHRLREAPKRITAVDWPATPAWQAPLPSMVFAGDTLHLLAGFATPPAGELSVTISDESGEIRQVRCPLTPPTDVEALPRLAAGRRLATMDDDEAATLAERYQLASRYTSFLVVQARADGEKAEGLPELRQVAQMLAAGWGATGSVLVQPMAARCEAEPAPFIGTYKLSADAFAADEARFITRSKRSFFEPGCIELDDLLDAPDGRDTPALPPARLLEALADLLVAGDDLPTAIDELHAAGLPRECAEELAAVQVVSGEDEEIVIALYIALLAASPAGGSLTADRRDALTGDWLAERELRALRQALKPLVSGVTAEAWSPAAVLP